MTHDDTPEYEALLTTLRREVGPILTSPVVFLLIAPYLALTASQGGTWSVFWLLFAAFALYGVLGVWYDVRKSRRERKALS